MKRAIPFVLAAALMLTGCKGGDAETQPENGTEAVPATTAADETTTTSAGATTAASQTSAETGTTTTQPATTLADASEAAALIEAGIIPPEEDDISAVTAEEPTFSLSSGNDAPIELPIIPIS